MASTYTSNSGIEKPGSGEQAGAWGSLLIGILTFLTVLLAALVK